jgi:hypothetical protein
MPTLHQGGLHLKFLPFWLALTVLAITLHLPGAAIAQIEIHQLLELNLQAWILDRGHGLNPSV